LYDVNRYQSIYYYLSNNETTFRNYLNHYFLNNAQKLPILRIYSASLYPGAV
jgi:hypothetical protein